MTFRRSFLQHVSVCALFLCACAPAPERLEPKAVAETITKDRAAVYKHDEIETPLRVEDAVARALRYNLDTRVAAFEELIAADDVTLEMLNTLPSVTAKMQRVGRNNPGGSSSFSLLTNTQSLQPSISSDQYRTVQQLNVEWNLLDAGINVGRAFTASDKVLIAQERRRKIYHDVVQDTYSAYWRVAAAQEALPKLADLLGRSEGHLQTIDQQVAQGLVPLADAQNARAKFLESRKQLMSMQQGLELAETELKTLINFPLDKPITLDVGEGDWLALHNVPEITASLPDLEDLALMNRPEIREEILNKRISLRDIRLSILQTLPGAELIFTGNRDSNSFLSYKSWVDGIVGLTYAINKIITAPARYGRAKNVDELADRRREALVAAILTQVHVVKARHESLRTLYGEITAIDKNAHDALKRARDMKDVGLLSKASLLSAEIDAGIANINRMMAQTELQDSYARFISTIGIDVWGEDNPDLTEADLAGQIRQNMGREIAFLPARSVTTELMGESVQ